MGPGSAAEELQRGQHIHAYMITMAIRWREHHIQICTRTNMTNKTIYMYMDDTKCVHENRRKYMMYSTTTTQKVETDSGTASSVSSGLMAIVQIARCPGACFTSTGGAAATALARLQDNRMLKKRTNPNGGN